MRSISAERRNGGREATTVTEPINDLTAYGHDQDRGPPQTREDRDRLEDFSPDDFDIEPEPDAADEHDQTA